MDKTIGIADLRGSIASVIKEVHEDGAQYVVLQRSKAKAVLLSPEKLETLEVMADKDLLEDIRAAKEDIMKGRYVSFDDYFGKGASEKAPAKHRKPQARNPQARNPLAAGKSNS